MGPYHIDSALVYGLLFRYRSSLHLFMEVNEKVLFVGKIKLDFAVLSEIFFARLLLGLFSFNLLSKIVSAL